MSREASSGVTPCVGLVAVGVIPSPQTLPNVTEGEGSGLGELFDVAKLVQKELRVETRSRSEEYGASESDGGYGSPSQQPTTDSKRKAAPPIAQASELGPSVREIGWQVELLSRDLLRDYREISQRSPAASTVSRLPSLRTTIVPARSVRIVRAPIRPSAASTSTLG